MPVTVRWAVFSLFATAVGLGFMSVLFSEAWWVGIIINVTTTIAWAIGIGISVVAVAKSRAMKETAGVSIKTYLSLVATTEVFYTIGAIMILSAMGINVMKYLAEGDLWRFYEIISQFDMTTMKIVGVVGWAGFILNRAVSFISPCYLLIAGGEKLHRYFRASAWTEIALESATTILIFFSLFRT